MMKTILNAIKAVLLRIAFVLGFIVGTIESLFANEPINDFEKVTIVDYDMYRKVDNKPHATITCGLVRYDEVNHEINVVWNDMSVCMRGTDELYPYTKMDLVEMVYANVDDAHKKALYKLLENGNMLTKKLDKVSLILLSNI